jgi:hypothetical protein
MSAPGNLHVADVAPGNLHIRFGLVYAAIDQKPPAQWA